MHQFFVFNDTATTEIYTLSLHDALPIWGRTPASPDRARSSTSRSSSSTGEGSLVRDGPDEFRSRPAISDRKSTRLNSSHANISYAVFCLKKHYTMALHHPPRASAHTPPH